MSRDRERLISESAHFGKVEDVIQQGQEYAPTCADCFGVLSLLGREVRRRLKEQLRDTDDACKGLPDP